MKEKIRMQAKGKLKKKVLAVMFVPLLLVSCNRQEEKKETRTPAQIVTQEEAVKPASMLKLVPDDTIFFFGGLEPVPLKELLQWNVNHFKMPDSFDPKELLEPARKKAETQGQRMALQLWADYYETAVSQQASLASWGIPDSPQVALYAVGLSPVLRISLHDVGQFNKKIEEIESKAQAKAEQETLGKFAWRRYPLTASGPKMSLIIGTDSSDAVFMLDVGADSDDALALAIGRRTPAKSLAESGRLESLQAEYKLHPAFVGYIDHRQIVTGLTTKDGNQMAKMVRQLAPQLPEKAAKPLAELQTEGCQKDFKAIADNWPQTIGGYTAFDLQGKPSRIDSLTVVESKDKALLDGLRSLRGFVPDYTDDQAAFSFGLGLTMENVAPFFIQQWKDVTAKQYSCPLLQEMQADLKTKNPAAAGIAASMAAGVRGLAFSLFDVQMEQPTGEGQTPMPKSLDALLSLSAKDPVTLVQTIAAFFPPLAALDLPADGSPVPLPVPVSLPVTPSAAVNGQHLTVYVGKQGEKAAKALAGAALDSSPGIMAASIDYSRYYQLAGDLIAYKAGERNADVAALFEAMKKAKMRVRMKLDFTERGIEMTADMIAPE
jgi:hypothetical protein